MRESGGFAPDAVADHGGRVQARVCLAHHAGDSVLPLFAAGPERSAAGGDFGEAGGGSFGNGGVEPCAFAGPARAADSGIFQYSGGPFVRRAGAGGILPEETTGAGDGGFARCRRRGKSEAVREK